MRGGPPSVSMMTLASGIVLLAGCAHSINWSDPSAIANHVEIRQDAFRKATSFIGPNCAHDQADTLKLRAFKARDGKIEYQIYVADQYLYEVVRGGFGWRLYAGANDSDGNTMTTTQISRDLDWCGEYKCSYIETLGISITREYLEERKDRGVTFKIGGKRGEEVFSIPPAYVQAFLSKVN